MRLPTPTIEPEEILPDARHVEAGLPLAGLGVIERAINNRKLFIAWIGALGALALFAAVAVRVVTGNEGSAVKIAQENRTRVFAYRSSRGVITDRYGVIIAGNRSRFALVVFPQLLPRDAEAQAALWRRLEEVLEGPRELFEHFARVADQESEPFRLSIAPDLKTALFVNQHEAEFPGVIVIEERERAYNNGEAFSHLLGYVSETVDAHHGQGGLEAYYDRELQGGDGMRVWEQDARGGARRVIDLKDPQEGATMMLTIDAEMQKASYEILERHLRAIGHRRAALVAVDPRSGEILALISAPGYSPEALVKGLSDEEFRKLRDDPSNPFFNRAVSGLYPPGSTIKPFLAAAALAEHVIDPGRQIMVTGSIEVVNQFNPEVRYIFPDWKAHGLVDMARAIAVSSNVYFYTIGGGYGDQKGLGIGRMEQYLRRFGFGVETGIDLPGEAVGRIPTPDWKKRVKGEDWYIGDTYHTAIGQGDVVVTPLQLALATAAVANGGTLFKPRLVRRMGKEDVVQAQAQSQAIASANLAIPREGMRRSVLEGSSRVLNDLPIAVAGKTGTAETGRGTMHAWFTSFAPYENPEIVLTVIVEEGGEGNAVAAPIAKDIYKWYIEHRREKIKN